MQGNTLPIPFAFMVLFSINLWILIGIRGLWWVKTILISLTLGLGLLVWNSVDSYLGWPSHKDLPEEYQVLWASVQEPDLDRDGFVYLWARPVKSEEDLVPYDLFVYKPTIKEPRSYCLNYSRNLHQQTQKAIESLKKGKIVIGKNQATNNSKAKEESNASGEESEGDGSNSTSSSNGSGGESFGGDPYFFELPASKFIEKND